MQFSPHPSTHGRAQPTLLSIGVLEDMKFKGTWRDYQARILEEMDEHLNDRRLHVVAAPGAGKTVLGLEIVRRIGRPALVFAPTIAIRDQWEQRLCPMFLDALPAVGSISHDLGDLRELTLTTYQALDSLRRSDELDALIATLCRRSRKSSALCRTHAICWCARLGSGQGDAPITTRFRRRWAHASSSPSVLRSSGSSGSVRPISFSPGPPKGVGFCCGQGLPRSQPGSSGAWIAARCGFETASREIWARISSCTNPPECGRSGRLQ